jgi:hypothetical protein
MENSTLLKQLTLPVAVVAVFLSIAVVAGLLWYSASKDLTFLIWGKEFGAVASKPIQKSIDEKLERLEGRVKVLEQRLATVEATASASDKASVVNAVAKPLKKTRVLDFGQLWEEKELSFSIRLISVSHVDNIQKFTVEIKTSESPLYEANVYKGWSRNFDVGAHKVTLSITDVDVKSNRLTFLLSESEA